MVLNILLLVIGFVLLIRGADAFVEGASALAHRFNIPEIIIGLTIVAMGTSAPEAAVSISSVLHGANSVAIGNALGSNIVNILFVLGIAAVITPLTIKNKTVRYEIPFLIFSTLALMWFGVEHSVIARTAAGVLLLLFAMFLGYLYFNARREILNAEKQIPECSIAKMVVFLIFGLVALVLGSDLTVKSATGLATLLHIPGRIIGLTVIAIGTSLPELVTCITAARKKHVNLVIGNIIGSNIFNILFVLGLAGLVRPIRFEYVFAVDAAISVMITIMLWLCAIYAQKLNRKMGILFLICYAGYLVYLI